MTQFEGARDIPASIDIIVDDPNKYDIQTRTILQKIHAILTNFRLPKIAVAIGPRECSVFNTILTFLHGDKKSRVVFFGHDPKEFQKDTKITREVLKNYPINFATSESDLCRTLLQQDAFIVGVFSAKAVNEVREVLDAFSNDKSGVLFVQNYSRLDSPSHHLYAVERSLRLLELPDGSGECYSIKTK